MSSLENSIGPASWAIASMYRGAVERQCRAEERNTREQHHASSREAGLKLLLQSLLPCLAEAFPHPTSEPHITSDAIWLAVGAKYRDWETSGPAVTDEDIEALKKTLNVTVSVLTSTAHGFDAEKGFWSQRMMRIAP